MSDKLSLDSRNAALKVVASGEGRIQAPPATSSNSPQTNTVVIPHNQASTDVLFQVVADASALYLSKRFVTAPFATGDGRTSIDAYIDYNALYITATSATAGADQPAVDFPYYYTILIP